MRKKRGKKSFSVRQVIVLSLLIVFILMNLYILLFLSSKSSVATGFGTSATGSVSFEILGDLEINITHPLNQSYNFSVGDLYTLDLNVTSSMFVDSWIYSLFDNRHGVWVYEDYAFSPNITFNAVRWQNTLFVEATTSVGEVGFDNVSFFVFVPNTSPIIYNLSNNEYACESTSPQYAFYVFDADEDVISWQISNNPYFVIFPFGGNLTNTNLIITSLNPLPKDSAGGINGGSGSWPLTVEVTDGYPGHSHINYTNITVIEINNPPEINPPLGLPVATISVWNQGANSTLFKWVNITDLEYDSYSYGAHAFNILITNSTGQNVPLFGVTQIGGNGLLSFTATNQTPLDTYNVEVCVSDTGILNPHPSILVECGQDGGSQTTCDAFQLTITDINRAPTIIDYYPLELNFNVSGTQEIYFNITKFDPDSTIPDSYWYVDDLFLNYSEGTLFDEFRFGFPCGISGIHKVKAVITDGELNDSVEWEINVEPVDCPSLGSPGGGGGGGGNIISCSPMWACNPWSVCQHAETSLDLGILSGLDYRRIQENCSIKELSGERCGFQLRTCVDANVCNPSFNKPLHVQDCLYIADPGCSDGIKNCHNGDCELLVDCGGPCNACASCTDGVKNQGEEGEDCGGPCPWKCVPEVPLLKQKKVIYGFLILLLLIIIFVIIKLLRVVRYRRQIKTQGKPNL